MGPTAQSVAHKAQGLIFVIQAMASRQKILSQEGFMKRFAFRKCWHVEVRLEEAETRSGKTCSPSPHRLPGHGSLMSWQARGQLSPVP